MQIDVLWQKEHANTTYVLQANEGLSCSAVPSCVFITKWKLISSRGLITNSSHLSVPAAVVSNRRKRPPAALSKGRRKDMLEGRTCWSGFGSAGSLGGLLWKEGVDCMMQMGGLAGGGLPGELRSGQTCQNLLQGSGGGSPFRRQSVGHQQSSGKISWLAQRKLSLWVPACPCDGSGDKLKLTKVGSGDQGPRPRSGRRGILDQNQQGHHRIGQ